MIESIKEVLKDPKEIVVALSGVALLSYYYFYARKQIFGEDLKKRGEHKLQLTLQQLIKEPRVPNITKIIITEAPLDEAVQNDRRFDFRSSLTSRLKDQLLRRELTTLINCSPLKILNAGCQCFLESVTHDDADDDRELLTYYQNAVRCELLIEKTVTDIEMIKKGARPVYLLCDNNSLDLKVGCENRIWNMFLNENEITEETLKQNYQVVFHIRLPDNTGPNARHSNEVIHETWKGFPNYHEIYYDESLSSGENVERGIQIMMEGMRPFLPA